MPFSRDSSVDWNSLARRIVSQIREEYGPVDRDDALDAAYLGLTLARDDYDPKKCGSFRTHLSYRGLRLAIDDLRKRHIIQRRAGPKTPAVVPVSLSSLPAPPSAPNQPPIETFLTSAPITPQQRDILLERYQEELTIDQIAELHRLTPSEVRWQLQKAMKTIRKKYPNAQEALDEMGIQ